jgi:hypothetical protein
VAETAWLDVDAGASEAAEGAPTSVWTDGYRAIVGWWVAGRAVVLAAALTAQALRWPYRTWYPPLGSEPFALLRAWDGRWYRIVASRGYLLLPHQQSDPAFFPLYSIVLRAFHAIGIGFTVAGVAVSNLAFLAGLLVLYRLAATWLPETDARRTAIYAAIFPAGFVFSMLYPESLVLLLSALAGLLAWRGRWLGAAVAVAAATLGRPESVLLAIPIAALARRRWPLPSATARSHALTAIVAAPVSLVVFALYQQRTTGNALAFSIAERAWGREFSPLGIWRAAGQLATAVSHHEAWLYRDACLVAVYAGCLVLALRAGVPWSWVAAGGLILFLPLESGSFNSDGRFGLLALPVYSGLAVMGRGRPIDNAVRAASLALLAVGTSTVLLHWP